MFGLFDGDGWAWATTKAAFWLLVIIMVLGYIPDRAYYFIVSRTMDVGLVLWSPVNLCPPENGSAMPCPVPIGGVLPWQASPAQVALPAPRTSGVAAQLGTNLLYIGGSDGTAASATTFATKVDKGNFGAWAEGPALPAARTDASLAILTGTAYLMGGLGPDGAATNTVWSIGLDPTTSALNPWTAKTADGKADLPTLPAARSGAAAVAVSDGIVVAGGRGADGKPTATVWKATVDKNGVLGEFKEQPPLPHPIADAAIAFEGIFLWVYGGSDATGATGYVQRADYGPTPGPTAEPGAPAPTAAPDVVIRWASLDAANLPKARSGGAGFTANGALYLAGGSDGTTAHKELYWALPDSNGNLPGGWRHLDATDLSAPLADAAPIVTSATAILFGGTSNGAALATSTRSSLAPQEPFFRLGIAGVTVPGLQIGGAIGVQLGYLAAAGVGTGDFVLLVIVGWAFNHRTQISEWRERRKLAKEAKAPDPE
jgi:Galactose oxidase, central domain